MSFAETPPTDLRERLVNLPYPANAPPALRPADPVDLVLKLLILDPQSRLDALSITKHPWFWAGDPLVLPHGHPGPLAGREFLGRWGYTWNGFEFGDLVRPGVEAAYAGWHSTL